MKHPAIDQVATLAAVLTGDFFLATSFTAGQFAVETHDEESTDENVGSACVATALPYPVAACCCIIDMNHSENLWRV
jgi:hypothetical protein